MPSATPFLVVALLFPCAVLAQNLPSDTGPEGATAPPLIQAPADDAPAAAQPPTSTAEPRDTFPRTTPGRLLLGTLSGAVGTAAGGTLGGTLSLKPLASCGSFPGTVYCGESLVPLYVGMGLGSGLGVYTSGRLLGSKGSFLLTMLGAGLGTVPVALLSDGHPPGRPLVSDNGTHLVVSLLLPTAGALLFNELSHRFHTPASAQQLQAPGFQVAPTLGASPRGDLVGGLVGRF
ncbi:hypothetical protein ACLESD_22665 [Pyxidicoccus sp. 3LFB2]